MLVISRRPGDRILFPKLGVTIHVARVDGRTVRLGIEAPRSVQVLRHEVADKGRYAASGDDDAAARRHAARNRLQTALLALSLAQRKLELARTPLPEVHRQIDAAIGMLEQLDAEAALGASDRSENRDAALRPGRKTALVVEDNANERTLLAEYLQSCDYDVIEAGDGQDALEYLTTHDKPDVVLLDMSMPRLDGPATIRQIRGTPGLSGVKVIAVSGMGPRQADVAVGPGGVDRWYVKPVRPSVLVRELDQEIATTA